MSSLPQEPPTRPVLISNFDPEVYIDYTHLQQTLSIVRSKLNNRPLTYAEKFLYSHLSSCPPTDIIRGETYLRLRPDRVASPDSTGQTVLLQFLSTGLKEVAVPYTIHCDHLIRAEVSNTGIEDLGIAFKENEEVYEFIKSACGKFGVGFWKPGSGIIHQILLENYAFPGGLLIGTDSHTPNAGGLGMCAIGVGGADVVDVLAGGDWEVKAPRIIGVRLVGELNGWSAPKDIILKLAGILGTKGATGCVIEYFGPGVETISCTGMATCCNMGAELGATTSVFPFTDKMYDYLTATRRKEIADYARTYKDLLRSDEGAEYDQVIEIDLDSLEPHINGPFSPDAAIPISKFAQAVRSNRWPEKISVGLIGSCTNASYEDMSRAAEVAQQAIAAGFTSTSKLIVTPGSEQIRATLQRDGQLDTLRKIGGIVLANACGPCIGQWHRTDVSKGDRNSILSSYNRNFAGRNDGSSSTHAFLASPEIVVAMTVAGDLCFNPLRDRLRAPDGADFVFDSPGRVESLPKSGYDPGVDTYQQPPGLEERARLEVTISPGSERLQLLPRFPAWNGLDILDTAILIRCRGRTTTDDITAAGPWLRFRGHLDNISNNLLIGAVNSDDGCKNKVKNIFSGKYGAVPTTARDYKRRAIPWVVIGDANFGEGSSREHAALEIRHLGGVAVIAKSFARIHETNLKRQGLLPLTFVRAEDYDKLQPDDRIDLLCSKIAVGKMLRALVRPKVSGAWELELGHTINESQLNWFRAGSALNAMSTKQLHAK